MLLAGVSIGNAPQDTRITLPLGRRLCCSGSGKSGGRNFKAAPPQKIRDRIALFTYLAVGWGRCHASGARVKAVIPVFCTSSNDPCLPFSLRISGLQTRRPLSVFVQRRPSTPKMPHQCRLCSSLLPFERAFQPFETAGPPAVMGVREEGAAGSRRGCLRPQDAPRDSRLDGGADQGRRGGRCTRPLRHLGRTGMY